MGRFFIWLLKIYAWICLKLYFTKFQVSGLENIPEKGPLLFAVNHQNAFLDAVLIACTSTRFPYFLARADVFNSSVARFFLHWLKIMPIYRFRDGLGAVKKSLSIINNCIELLKHDQAVLIFPEGNHDLKFSLRKPLQKGIARIAFGSQQSIKQDLKIIPVGVQYENHSSYGSRVLVSYGQPFSVKHFMHKGTDHPKEETEKLLQTLYEKMKVMMLHIPEDNYEKLLDQWKNNRVVYSDLISQLRSDQQTIKKLIENGEDTVTHNDKPVNLGKVLYFSARFLLKIIFVVPFLVIKLILKFTVEDPVFIGPMQFSWGMIFYPMYYVASALVIHHFTTHWLYTGAYLAAVPLLIIISNLFKAASLR